MKSTSIMHSHFEKIYVFQHIHALIRMMEARICIGKHVKITTLIDVFFQFIWILMILMAQPCVVFATPELLHHIVTNDIYHKLL